MRNPGSPRPLATSLLVFAAPFLLPIILPLTLNGAAWASAAPQEPSTEPAPRTPPRQPAGAEQPRRPAGGAEQAPRPRRGGTLALQGAMVHPVSGPAIADGVVVLRGDRIVAVGKQGEVEIPEGSTVRNFPGGHIYPGLIDAATDAYTDNNLRGDGSLDAGASFADDLQLRRNRDDELLRAGITTAYITVRSGSQLRGQGAIVRPRSNGFELWRGQEQAGVQMRMTNGPQPSHALQRQQQLDGLANALDGLEEYRKAQEEHNKALEKYKKDFADYLAFHQKKKDAEKPKEAPPARDGQAAPAGPARDGSARDGSAPAGGEGPGSERRRPPGGRGGEPPRRDGAIDSVAPSAAALAAVADPQQAELDWAIGLLLLGIPSNDAGQLTNTAQPQDPVRPPSQPAQGGPATGRPAPGGQGQPQAGNQGGDKKDDGPKRPTWPKAPPKDPNKEALLRVLDGELPLRIEAHRPDEIAAALRLQDKYSIPLLVIEQAYGGAALADEFAQRGTSVVLTEVLPGSMPKLYEDFDVTALPAQLQAAGVPFAIASGNARRASLLPLMAATAVGRGLDPAAALRAITLTPAEILGVAKDTGSLQPGKYADVLVCDRPLFASDCRVLFVLSQGRPDYEAK